MRTWVFIMLVYSVSIGHPKTPAPQGYNAGGRAACVRLVDRNYAYRFSNSPYRALGQPFLS